MGDCGWWKWEVPAWLTSPLRLITAARLIRSRACRGCVPAAGVQRAAANVGARGCSAAAPCPGRAVGEQPCCLLPVLHRGTGVSWGTRSSFPKSRSKIHPFFQKPQSQLLPCHLLQVARESFSWAPCCSWKGLGACSGFPDVSFCRCRQMCYFFLPRGPAEMQRNKWAL